MSSEYMEKLHAVLQAIQQEQREQEELKNQAPSRPPINVERAAEAEAGEGNRTPRSDASGARLASPGHRKEHLADR